MAEELMDTALFDELVGALDEAVAYHRGAKLDLRTTVLPIPPDPMSKDAVKQLRYSLNLSQGVFAGCLNVSKKLVQAWEGGRRRADGAALRLLRLAQDNPSLVVPTASPSGSSNVSKRRTHTRPVAVQRQAHGAAKRVPTGRKKVRRTKARRAQRRSARA